MNTRKRCGDQRLRQRTRSTSVERSEDEDVPPPIQRIRRASPLAASGDDTAINQLTDVLANFIRTQEARTSSVSNVLQGNAVPRFDPEEAGQSSVDWCRKVEELQQNFRWSDETTLFFAVDKLRGLADVWYRGLPTINLTWEEWKSELQAAFPPDKDYYDLLEDMMKRRKREDESFSKYFHEKMAMINNCRITGSDAVACIIGGINNQMVKLGARAGNYQRPQDLYRYLSNVKNTTSTGYSIRTLRIENIPNDVDSRNQLMKNKMLDLIMIVSSAESLDILPETVV